MANLDHCSVRLRDDARAEVAGTSGHSTTKCADGTILVEPSEAVRASFGRVSMVVSSRHRGERHLDGDELIYLVSGAAAISLLAEDADVEERVDLDSGRVVIVPQGPVAPCRYRPTERADLSDPGAHPGASATVLERYSATCTFPSDTKWAR
jgi:hypothetical protein